MNGAAGLLHAGGAVDLREMSCVDVDVDHMKCECEFLGCLSVCAVCG